MNNDPKRSKEIQRVPRKPKTGNNEEADQLHPRGFKVVWSLCFKPRNPWILIDKCLSEVQMVDKRYTQQAQQATFAEGCYRFSMVFLSRFQEKEERELSLVSDSARKLLEESREAQATHHKAIQISVSDIFRPFNT